MVPIYGMGSFTVHSYTHTIVHSVHYSKDASTCLSVCALDYTHTLIHLYTQLISLHSYSPTLIYYTLIYSYNSSLVHTHTLLTHTYTHTLMHFTHFTHSYTFVLYAHNTHILIYS